MNFKFRIKEIGHNPDSSYPVVGYFPSGYDPLFSESKPNPSVKVFRSVNSRNPRDPRMQVVVGDFVGTNYSGNSTTPQLSNYALGVFDKETGVLKMVPIASNRIFRLEPEERDAFGNILDEEQKDLMRCFYDPLPIRISDPVKRKLEAIEAYKRIVEERKIPPHNVKATSPDMAYPLNKIVFDGDWKYLADIFDLVEAGSDVTPDVYPIFVCNRVHKIAAIKDEEKRKTMAGILSYITHLIKFKDMQDGVSSTRRHKLPSILAQRFSSLFSETEDKSIRDEKQKLLIGYVLVLSLFADDFRSDPSDIAKDLRMSHMLLRDYYEFLGCKFSNEKVVVATLSVPLEFPTRKRRRR